eukprot:15330772-Ditylum_brightwellii.AAC.1
MAPSSSTLILTTVLPSFSMASKNNLMILVGTLLALVGKPKKFLDLASMMLRTLLKPRMDGLSKK